MGPTAKLVKIKSLPIELAGGDSHAYVHEIGKDAVIFIGHAKFDMDLLVAPILAVDLFVCKELLCDMECGIFKPQPSILTIGVEEQHLVQIADPRKKKAYTPTQDVPAKFTVRHVPMPIKVQD